MNKKTCPFCMSINVMPIIYGYPSSDMIERYEKGLIKLGGCVVREGSPQWYCKDCDREF